MPVFGYLFLLDNIVRQCSRSFTASLDALLRQLASCSEVDCFRVAVRDDSEIERDLSTFA
jgi:hypothetical protein